MPVTGVVLPGSAPPGFGAPWLNTWLFQVTPKALRSPPSLSPLTVICGVEVP
ncbi:Uncharacterised protein [Mycobacteroides abscessus subsp. abscessus]|nr:Uncharacterised protein [Mycobacteroides abscessus subsp. abscessus]